MNKLLILLVSGLMTFTALNAQKITELENTAQGWSGGVCCKSGVNYNFNLQFEGFKNEVIPDTIWVGGYGIFLSVTDSPLGYGANVQRTKTGKALKFRISVGTSHDEMDDFRHTGREPEKPKPAPIEFAGVALLSYHEKGSSQRCFYIVKTIKELEYQDYP